MEGPGDDYLARLAKYPALLAEAKQMRQFAGQIRFAVQETQEGYGHAVYQTKEFAAGEPVLLCLGTICFAANRFHPAASWSIGRGGGWPLGLGGESHRPGGIERLRHHCRQTAARSNHASSMFL